MTLEKALIIPKAIFEKNAGKPIFRVTLAEELKYKSAARIFRDLITASAGYGLTNGSYISEKISLEQLGNDSARGITEAVFNALFSSEVFQKFYDNFGSGGSKGIPSEKIARDYLHNECGIPERQSKGVLENIIQNAKDWQLIQNIAGGDKFVPIELAKEKIGANYHVSSNNDVSEDNKREDVPASEKPSNVDKHKPNVNISPNLQLNIQIHIAADTPDEKIEVLFKNMRFYLLNNGE